MIGGFMVALPARADTVVATSTYPPADATIYYDSEPNTLQRASDGGLIDFFTSASDAYLYYVTSANGTTWSAPVAIDNDAYGHVTASSYMDASGNVYLVYYLNYNTYLGLKEVEFTYNGSGSWTMGTKYTIDSNSSGVDQDPSILLDNSGTLWVAYNKLVAASTYAVDVSTSTTSGTTWSSPTQVSATSTSNFVPTLALYNQQYPVLAYFNNVTIYSQFYNGSSWSSAVTVDAGSVAASFHIQSIGNNVMYVGARSQYGLLKYSLFNGSTQTWPALTTISASANDTYYPNVVTDGTDAWTLYGHYNGSTNNYDIYERKWNGASWDATGTPLTTTGNNNAYPQVPQTISSGSSIPYVYMSGAASPYTIYYNSFAPGPLVVGATGTGSWTVPAGVTSVKIELWGGGGGGGYVYGGGAGAYVSTSSVPVTPGSTITYTIAGGGPGGATTAVAGGTGYRNGGAGPGSSNRSGSGGGGSSDVTNGTWIYIASGGGGSGRTAGGAATSNVGGAGAPPHGSTTITAAAVHPLVRLATELHR